MALLGHDPGLPQGEPGVTAGVGLGAVNAQTVALQSTGDVLREDGIHEAATTQAHRTALRLARGVRSPVGKGVRQRQVKPGCSRRDRVGSCRPVQKSGQQGANVELRGNGGVHIVTLNHVAI